MLGYYLKVAIRAGQRRPSYLLTSLAGLGLGLFCLVVVLRFANYENNHDAFFPDAEQIAMVHTDVTGEAGFGTGRIYGAPPVLSGFAEGRVDGVEAISGYVTANQSVRNNNIAFYESIKFVDPAFLNIFQFDYLDGGPEGALDGASSVVVTEELAQRYFGRTAVAGESLIIGGGETVTIAAVIRNLPTNSHFVYRFGTQDRLQILAPMELFRRLGPGDVTTSWTTLSDIDRVYLKLAPNADVGSVEAELDGVLAANASEDDLRLVRGFGLTRLTKVNAMIWDLGGVTVIDVAVVFAYLILLVSVFNFANIFSAHIYGRSNEWGLRRAFGAGRKAVWLQLVTEALLMVFGALLLGLFAGQLLIPLLGNALQKQIDLFSGLRATDVIGFGVLLLAVAAFAVLKPASLLSRSGARELLERAKIRGAGAGRTRVLMVVGQLIGGSFLSVIAAVTWVQNDHMAEMELGFDADGVVSVYELDQPEILSRLNILTNALRADPAIGSVTASGQLPFEQIFQTGRFDRRGGDGSSALRLLRSSVDGGFFKTFRIPLVAGRLFDRNRADDREELDRSGTGLGANVIINRLAADALGFDKPESALGQQIFLVREGANVAYTIVGVVDNANLPAFTNAARPMVYQYRPSEFRVMALRAVNGDTAAATAALNRIWRDFFPATPLVARVLTEDRDARFRIFAGINMAVMALAGLAMAITCLGLFGLVSLYAAWRQKEVAIRKVLGASRFELQRLLSWQFLKPVLWSFMIALPLAWVVANAYLSNFANQIDNLGVVIAGVALGVLILSWFVISGQIYRLASISPALVLNRQ